MQVTTMTPTTPATSNSKNVMRNGQTACAICVMAPLCHPGSNDCRTPAAIEKRTRLRSGDVLVTEGAPQQSVFAVRAGFMKVVARREGARSHVVRFLLPGDGAGLEAFAKGTHVNEVVALGDCEVCSIPVTRAESSAKRDPVVGAHFRRLLAEELVDTQTHSVLLSRLTARQRVISFILDLSRRWSERGYSESTFRLPMGRRDIGDHLGVTIETVSRVLSELRSKGWIAVTGRSIEIVDAKALRENA